MTQFTFHDFLCKQHKKLPLPDKDLTGKTVVVTGSNQGLGFESTTWLAKLGASKIILACRNVRAGQEAAEKIKAVAARGTVVDSWKLDLDDMKSVIEFSEKVSTQLDRLDVLILNAGIWSYSYQASAENIERTIKVNNVSNTLLALRLVPIMQATAAKYPDPRFKPHITFLSSDLHLQVTSFPERKEGQRYLDMLSDKSTWNGDSWYRYSKVINVMDSQSVARFAGEGIIVNAVNPGFCKSQLTRDAGGVTRYIVKASSAILARTTEEGSRTIVWAATNDMPTGSYSDSCTVYEPSDFVLSEQGQKIRDAIWKEYQPVWRNAVGFVIDSE